MIRNIILQQKEERDTLLNQQYIPRLNSALVSEYLNTTLIKLISGPRRAGKSVMALQILQQQQFAYLNFDDDLLLKQFDEDLIIQGLIDVYKHFDYLLLDEIQNLPNWELWVGKLYRRGTNLIITGSNSRMLSNEMATVLTGRYLQITVLPFSFKEVLEYNHINVDSVDLKTPASRGVLFGYLEQYLFNGGFPEIVKNQGIVRNYLTTLFDSILLKDIIKRFRVRQTQEFYDLSNFMLSNYTNPFTYSQIREVLGFNSVNTIRKFIGYLEEPWLFKCITRYSNKISNHSKTAQKTYIIDNGFIKARSFELSPNYGRLLENLVFVELIRRGYNPGQGLFYYRTRNKKEVDFIIRHGHVIEQLIQVCYNPSSQKVLKRETSALFEASEEVNCSNLLLLSWDTEDTVVFDQLRVSILPVWKWLFKSH